MKDFKELKDEGCPLPVSGDQLPLYAVHNPRYTAGRAILQENYTLFQSEKGWRLMHEQADLNHARWKGEAHPGLDTGHVQVVYQNMTDVLQSFVTAIKGEIPAVLNLADSKRCFGLLFEGYLGTQEEALGVSSTAPCYVRKADLSNEGQYQKSVGYAYTKEMTDKIDGSDPSGVCLNKDNRILYFRQHGKIDDSGVVSGYELLPKEALFYIYELRSAAQSLSKEGDPFDAELAERQIRQQLKTLKDNNIPNALLFPFGCGAFHNPPERVAEIYARLLSSDEFLGFFKNVIFSVIDRKNFEVFYGVLHGLNLRKSINPPAEIKPADMLKVLMSQASWYLAQGNQVIRIDFTQGAHNYFVDSCALYSPKFKLSEQLIALKDINIQKLQEYLDAQLAKLSVEILGDISVRYMHCFPYIEINLQNAITRETDLVSLRRVLSGLLSALDLNAEIVDAFSFPTYSEQKAVEQDSLLQDLLSKTSQIALPEALKIFLYQALLKQKGRFTNFDAIWLGEALFKNIKDTYPDLEVINGILVALDQREWLETFGVEATINALLLQENGAALSGGPKATAPSSAFDISNNKGMSVDAFLKMNAQQQEAQPGAPVGSAGVSLAMFQKTRAGGPDGCSGSDSCDDGTSFTPTV